MLSHSKNKRSKTWKSRKQLSGKRAAALKRPLRKIKYWPSSSRYERRAIEARAKSANLSVSEYLREMALTGKIDRREKALPKEVLAYTGTLNHIAANLNQIAKKRSFT